MKAAVNRCYGGPEVVSIQNIPKPVPKDDEVLIRVYATTVNSADWRIRSLTVPTGFKFLVRLAFGINVPRKQVLGCELSGVIEAVGSNISKFKPGDAVFADCGTSFGAHAEYKTMAEDGAIALKPVNLTFEQAAALSFGSTTALSFFTKAGGIRQGDTVLVNGASGTTGLAFVQLARHFGATVTGVSSAGNHGLLRQTGAQHVIDYQTEDFSKNGQCYDFIVDTAGTAPWKRAKSSLTETGALLAVLGPFSDMLKAAFVSRRNGQRLIVGTTSTTGGDLRMIARLALSGAFIPVLDRVLPIADIRAAHERVDSGRKTGSVVVRFEQSQPEAQNTGPFHTMELANVVQHR